MDKITYRLIHNRRNALNTQGEALVQVEARLNGKKAYITTKVYLKPEHWDKKTAQVTGRTDANELNAYLYEFKIRLEEIELDMWKRGKQCTLSALKTAHKANRTPTKDFYDFAEEAIQDSSRKPSTKENMQTTVTTLKAYKPKMEISDITPDFVKHFEKHLHTRGKAVNTIGKHMRQLRTIVNEAINQGYMSEADYPFRAIKIKKEKGRSTYLTQRELERLERYETDDTKKRRVADAFLFCCYTGLRFSDFTRLTEENIIRRKGKTWLQIRTKKTSSKVSIPLDVIFSGKALRYVPKLCNLTGLGSNSQANALLKAITKEAGIDKRVTWHTARHTCATLLVYQGVQITTVQKLLGHADLSTTQVYADIMEDTILKDLKKVRSRQRVDVCKSTVSLPTPNISA